MEQSLLLSNVDSESKTQHVVYSHENHTSLTSLMLQPGYSSTLLNK